MWQTLESAPKDGSRILVCWARPGEETHYELVFWNEYRDAWSASDGGWGSDRWRADDAPTHWMPLPEPPEIVDDRAEQNEIAARILLGPPLI